MPNHGLKHRKVHTGLFVQILDHCMAEAMKSLGSRFTMLTTHSYNDDSA